ncbi:4-hydroxybenzoate 3-monooxygenase [soil metagenome]
MSITTTRVGIVGAGPAGLMLAHLLSLAGIDSVALDLRTRREIEETHRAGILERDSVRLLTESGVSDRVLTEGHEHRGIDLRFDGASHRIDFPSLAGASTWLYPQTEVFVDLADARERDGGDVRFGVRDVRVELGDPPTIRFVDHDGAAQELRCELVVGTDGSRGLCRDLLPEGQRRRFAREYPFAWFGILCEAPRSAEELIYARSDRGFALISSRTETIQRMYFQCDPTADVADWSREDIWAELQARVAGPDGLRLVEGPIIERSVLPFRSFVQEPMRHGRLLLAGDAAHTVPPTGAKGLNLALADVRVLSEVIEQALNLSGLANGDLDVLDAYSPRALARVWKAQHFSYWMTTLLHRPPESSGASAFDERRQLGELESLVSSEAGSRYLAEAYSGWPSAT